MKKFILFVTGLFLSVGVMISCSERNSEKEREDSIRIADSLAAVEEAEAAAEQGRLDSIRQDSIAFEEKMNMAKTEFFIHDGKWKSILPKYGFELVNKKTYRDAEYEDQWEDWADYVYTRNINGRKVTFTFTVCESWGPDEYDAEMIIKDPAEREAFIKFVKKLGKAKDNCLYEDWDHGIWVFADGNKITFRREH